MKAILKVVLVLCLILISLVLIACTSHTNEITTPESPYIPKEYKLRQLVLGQENSNSGNGDFFLGTGSISYHSNVTTYFFFYTEDKDGKINLQKENSVNVSIYEDGGNKAIYWGFGNKDNDWWTIWELHIPPNSIKNNFQINLVEEK
jgi:uncharacterized protein YcfL